MIQEAYVLGVSTRRVDDLVRAPGLEGISRSEVSRICAALDTEVAAFRGRSLAGEAYPYLWLDATYLKVREQRRVVSMAALVATGVARSGERRILGFELSPGNDEGSAWPAFTRSLVERGLHGVRLVISDDQTVSGEIDDKWSDKVSKGQLDSDQALGQARIGASKALRPVSS